MPLLCCLVTTPAFGQLVGGMSTSGPSITMTDEKLARCAVILRNSALKMRDRIYK